MFMTVNIQKSVWKPNCSGCCHTPNLQSFGNPGFFFRNSFKSAQAEEMPMGLGLPGNVNVYKNVRESPKRD
jgi:hypothetical protein